MQQPGQGEAMARSGWGAGFPRMEDGGETSVGVEGSDNGGREPSEWALSDVAQRRCFLSSQYFPLVGDLAWRA